MDMETIEKRIQSAVLTKTDRKIADYIMDHLDTMGIETVTEMAKALETSDTSIIRLLRKLGYAGFADFKKQMADRMVQQYRETVENLSTGEKYLKSSSLLTKGNEITDVMEKTVSNIQYTFVNLNPENLTAIANCLIKSKRKFIAGFRSTAACSIYMYRKLISFLPNVVNLQYAESEAIEKLTDITKSDCLVLYSFSRYSEINYTLLDMAKEAGARVVLITDKPSSPLAGKADFVISCAIVGAGVTNSYIVPICVSEVIVLLVSKMIKESDKRRINKLTENIGRNRLY